MNRVKTTLVAASVQTDMEARAKTFGINDPSGEALEGAAMNESLWDN